MKIAVLSDIHGNSVALEAVLGEVRALEIEHILVLGDMVGYYYHPDEVLRLLGDFSTTYIRGNHEQMLEDAWENPKAAQKIENKYGHGISVALNLLSREQIEMLVELPETTTVKLSNTRFFLCHGSPWKNDEYIYPDSPPTILAKCALVEADYVLMGNTHFSFVHRGGGATVLNPGSVGQSRDHGGAACWAVIDTVNGNIVFKRTPFDMKSIIEEIQKMDPSVAYLREVLQR